MRTLTAVAAAILLATLPAHAEACRYVTADHHAALFIDPSAIEVSDPTGRITKCSTFSGGTGSTVRGMACEDGFEGPMFFAPSELGSETNDLLIMRNAVWYAQCDAGAPSP